MNFQTDFMKNIEDVETYMSFTDESMTSEEQPNERR